MKQVLVVDDSTVIRKVAKRILEGLNFQTLEAEDGAKALSACTFVMPDAILLDWNMPVMDGFEFLRELRKMPGRPEAEGRFLHDGKRRRAYRPGHSCRRRRIYHEAVRQADPAVQARGNRPHLIGFAHPRSHSGLKLACRNRFTIPRRQPTSAFRLASPPPDFGVGRLPQPGPRMIVIGASTGGPQALSIVLKGLVPAIEQVPVFIVLHIPPEFTEVIVEPYRTRHGSCPRMRRSTARKSPRATSISRPADLHSGVSRFGDSGVIALSDDPPENFCKPSVDVSVPQRRKGLWRASHRHRAHRHGQRRARRLARHRLRRRHGHRARCGLFDGLGHAALRRQRGPGPCGSFRRVRSARPYAA